MGFIYIIKNNKTDKVYVGQTHNEIKDRWRQHRLQARQEKPSAKLYKAMREIGIDNFYVEQLMECGDGELNKYEQLYVEQYNSIDNGYNTVYPCSSHRKPVRDYEDKVIDMYVAGYSPSLIAQECGVSTGHVRVLVKRHGVTREELKYTNGIGSQPVVMYSDDFIPLRTFKTKADAFRWIKENTEFKATTFGFYENVNVACKTGNMCYGHRWQLLHDIECDDKVFRSIFDVKLCQNGEKAEKSDKGNYWIVRHALRDMNNRCKSRLDKLDNTWIESAVTEYKAHYKTYICDDCGKAFHSLSERSLCISCEQVRLKGLSKKPTKEELKDLLDRGFMVTEIAEIYGRSSAGTVHRWIKTYGLR